MKIVCIKEEAENDENDHRIKDGNIRNDYNENHEEDSEKDHSSKDKNISLSDEKDRNHEEDNRNHEEENDMNNTEENLSKVTDVSCHPGTGTLFEDIKFYIHGNFNFFRLLKIY
uniref:Uncharacterized protein n=1 Tax=Timema cristinae TaxID=61476 RepID=A0A7R9H727_TIMCR|nr:unnamed protein product [Timema cristinae]